MGRYYRSFAEWSDEEFDKFFEDRGKRQKKVNKRKKKFMSAEKFMTTVFKELNKSFFGKR